MTESPDRPGCAVAAQVAGLVTASDRLAAADSLAKTLGVLQVVPLIADPATGRLLPPPGFRRTLSGGEGWRELLDAVRTPGTHRGTVNRDGAMRPALAYAVDGFALAIVGERVDQPGFEVCDADTRAYLLPLLRSCFAAELAMAIAEGEVRAARERVSRQDRLTEALDRTRTALEEQGRHLDDARARAEQSARAKDAFLAMLGHELRNPLAPIVTALELLESRDPGSHEIEVIRRQVRHVERLVDDLLDVTRITRGKIELRPERVDLKDVLRRAIELTRPALDERHQTLALEVDEGLTVEVDPVRMAQVFANLLSNASKFSEHGSVIAVAAHRQEAAEGEVDRIVASVADQGVGLHPDMQERVFLLFEQGAQSRERARGGLGLGLAIVRNLVLLHGGSVRAESEGRGKGTTFTVELPAAEPAGARDDGSESAATTEKADREAVRVLVVDDNEDAAEMLSLLLMSRGHDVRIAHTGAQALDAVHQFRPQVALVDIGLPVMDGHTLGRLLREELGPDFGLVALTGYGQDSDRRQSAEAGFDAHMVKPARPAELIELVTKLAERTG